MDPITHADQAASLVLDQAMQAAGQGTFAVGGAIVENATGRVIHTMHNNVLKPLAGTDRVFTFDPTAHGERQLVYWYYANRDRLNLPAPAVLTIVTSLDPCAMCTGTLLTAGFNVGVVAMDDYAGINYDERFSFPDLPEGLRDQARTRFGYYACGREGQDPPPYVRQYTGGRDVAFYDTPVSAQRLAGCGDIFLAKANAVRENASDSGRPKAQLSDPAGLPDDAPVKKAFRDIYPDAFGLTLADFRLPDDALLAVLKRVKENTPQARNAVALVDPFGNLVLCLADRFDKSPVHTAFMNVTRAYATTRYALMDDPATRSQAEKHLTHPKFGTFVFLHAPNPGDAATIMGLGAYGSTMEGPVPQAFPANCQYFYPPVKGTVEDLSRVIMNLPPFYTDLVQVAMMETATGKPVAYE